MTPHPRPNEQRLRCKMKVTPPETDASAVLVLMNGVQRAKATECERTILTCVYKRKCCKGNATQKKKH